MQSASAENQAIQAALVPLLQHRGFALVQCTLLPKGRILRLLIERGSTAEGAQGSGVTLDDCTELSRLVSDVLDGEGLLDDFGAYRLEVSSPGLDRPLTCSEHFVRFVGEQVQVRTTEPAWAGAGRKFIARLIAADATHATLAPLEHNASLRLDYSQIDTARLVPRV